MIRSKATVRARVVQWVLFIQVLLLCALCVLFVVQARATIRAEQEAAQRAARDLVVSSLGALLAESDDALMQRLNDRLAPLRHVRMRFFDALEGEYPARASPLAEPAPPWVARLMAPPVRQMRIPVADRGRTLGVVWIEGASGLEVARVWQELRWLVGLSAVAIVVMSALLYWVIGRALAPLSDLRHALHGLEDGDLGTRVPVPASADLAPIARQVNHLATSLEATEQARLELSRQLTDLQEAERKHIAMELHDEMGPCLFGLSASADQLAQDAPAPLRPQIAALQGIIEQMRALNRRILGALRPMTVGQLPLEDVVRDLVATQSAGVEGVDVRLSIDPLPPTTEAHDLTVYRVVQEAMTNAFRHSGTDVVKISLRGDAGALIVDVRDHGAGIGAGQPGTGLRGMQERLRSMGGRLTIGPATGGGTLVSARLPLESP